MTTVDHICPPDKCEPCGIGPVTWKRDGKCCHCRTASSGWHENGKRVNSAACNQCYMTIQTRYLDRRCMATPCTHAAVM